MVLIKFCFQYCVLSFAQFFPKRLKRTNPELAPPGIESVQFKEEFYHFGGFKYGVWLFIVLLVRYKNRKWAKIDVSC